MNLCQSNWKPEWRFPLIPAPDKVESMFANKWANMGGPASRRRTEAINKTLLGDAQRHMPMPRVARAALYFGFDEPADVVRALMQAEGLSEADLRVQFPLPTRPCICRVQPRLRRLTVATAAPRRVLAQAALLGLSTAAYFDPARPLVFTRASLTRRLEIFEGEGFYA